MLASAWVEGHGIHLAANAIGHPKPTQPGAARDLTEFWDEKFSHYVWHAAALALSGLVMVRHMRSRGQAAGPWWPGIVAAAAYGFAIFLIGDEGGTPPLVVPFAAAVTVAAVRIGRHRLQASPVLVMFGLGYPVAMALFAMVCLLGRRAAAVQRDRPDQIGANKDCDQKTGSRKQVVTPRIDVFTAL